MAILGLIEKSRMLVSPKCNYFTFVVQIYGRRMKKMLFKFCLLQFFVGAFLFLSCNPGKKDIADNKTAIHIQRFEQDLFSIDLYSLKDSVPWLLAKYPEFLPLFSYKVINIGKPGDYEYANRLLAFVSDFTNYRVSRRVKEVFPDLNRWESELSSAFDRYREAFPGETVPQVISCITGFNQSIITSDSLLAISLDKYLGSNDEFYNLLYPPVPEYMRRFMIPEKITSDAMLAWIITQFEYNDTRDNLLSQMIYNGRAFYCVKELMPQLQDTLLWRYTEKQMQFCRKNERGMWEYLVQYKKLFETDQFTVNQLINEAPFTNDFSKDSPGRAVVWIGYNIVVSYMKHNSHVRLDELMKENDYQKIMNLSKYNP
jgi:hypothetical protein